MRFGEVEERRGGEERRGRVVCQLPHLYAELKGARISGERSGGVEEKRRGGGGGGEGWSASYLIFTLG